MQSSFYLKKKVMDIKIAGDCKEKGSTSEYALTYLTVCDKGT